MYSIGHTTNPNLFYPLPSSSTSASRQPSVPGKHTASPRADSLVTPRHSIRRSQRDSKWSTPSGRATDGAPDGSWCPWGSSELLLPLWTLFSLIYIIFSYMHLLLLTLYDLLLIPWTEASYLIEPFAQLIHHSPTADNNSTTFCTIVTPVFVACVAAGDERTFVICRNGADHMLVSVADPCRSHNYSTI